jgi:hypothetical protein
MRYVWRAAIVMAALAALSTTGWAQSKCPSSATEASKAVWPSGGVSKGKTVTGSHPCGRRLQCTGGSTAQKGGGRSCRWL